MTPDAIHLDTEYSGPLARLFDRLHADDNDEEFWLSVARKSGGPILELGCGTGRILLYLAREGLDVMGIDGSSDMLAQLQEKLASESEEVRDRLDLVEAHFDTFQLGRKFDLAFFSCDTFQHLVGTEVQLAALKRVKEHLVPGGRLIIDQSLPDPATMLAESGTPRRFYLPEENDLSWRITLTPNVNFRLGMQTDFVLIEQILQPDDSEEVVQATYRARADMALLFPREIMLLLRAAGFHVETCYSDYSRGKFSGDEDQFICVAHAV